MGKAALVAFVEHVVPDRRERRPDHCDYDSASAEDGLQGNHWPLRGCIKTPGVERSVRGPLNRIGKHYGVYQDLTTSRDRGDDMRRIRPQWLTAVGSTRC
jgi:hypothetical protein